MGIKPQTIPIWNYWGIRIPFKYLAKLTGLPERFIRMISKVTFKQICPPINNQDYWIVLFASMKSLFFVSLAKYIKWTIKSTLIMLSWNQLCPIQVNSIKIVSQNSLFFLVILESLFMDATCSLKDEKRARRNTATIDSFPMIMK